MYIERIPNRNSRPAVLLREGWREEKVIKKRTIANLTNWPEWKIETLKRLLEDEKMIVRNYKRLTQVEWLIRCMKGVDLLVRPIHHRTEEHVRAHIFLCMLAYYYVEFHMRKALAPLLFEDEELDEARKNGTPLDRQSHLILLKSKRGYVLPEMV